MRRADNGLLFLDEIGELGLDEQAMLLHALEEKVFYPRGSDREVASDFQLLVGTNRDPFAQLAAGKFREDLLARINLWTFRLPELRERPEDLEPNLDYELQQSAKAIGVNVTFSSEARAGFLSFATGPAGRWPGNFRDFAAAVRRMATLAEGGRITHDQVREELHRLREAWSHGAAESADPVGRLLGEKKKPVPSIGSIGPSSPRSCASANKRSPSPRRDGSCFRSRARCGLRSTMLTA